MNERQSNNKEKQSPVLEMEKLSIRTVTVINSMYCAVTALLTLLFTRVSQ
jgi:hypothetical protein